MLKPEYIFIWILFHLGAVELPRTLANRSKPKTPAYEQVNHMRYQNALASYQTLNDVKLAVEYRSIATALSKLNQNDSALVVYSKMLTKFPNSILNRDLLEIALISRKVGKYTYSDSLISVLKAGEYSYLNVFDDYLDTNFHHRHQGLDLFSTSKKKFKFNSNSLVNYGAVRNPRDFSWYFHTKELLPDGLLNSISGTDKQSYGQIRAALNWNSEAVSNGQLLQDRVINRYVELSHIDSFGNYYVTMNNRFVNDSDQFLLQSYRYFYNPKIGKYTFEGIGLEQYYYNVSSFVLNESRTKGLFCSDMPGSLGKSDVWICDIAFDKSGKMSITNIGNLGPKVNTILSESDPVFINDEIIAFASEGRVGFGGYDLYFYSLLNNEVSNAGTFINTVKDEFFPKYYDGKLYYSASDSANTQSLYSVNVPYETIYESVLPFVPPAVVENHSVDVVANGNQSSGSIQNTLDKVRKESINKYDYARKMSFVLLSDSVRLETIKKIDSSSNYKDYKFMTLFHIDNEFVIEKDFEQELEIVAALLNKRSDWGLEIRSYTDSRGPKMKNLKLSQSRADYVAEYLKNKGVNPGQILPIGFGESMLINHCADGIQCAEEEHRQNRRTELIITPVFYWKKSK